MAYYHITDKHNIWIVIKKGIRPDENTNKINLSSFQSLEELAATLQETETIDDSVNLAVFQVNTDGMPEPSEEKRITSDRVLFAAIFAKSPRGKGYHYDKRQTEYIETVLQVVRWKGRDAQRERAQTGDRLLVDREQPRE